jgi:hypothetical protein
VRPAAFVLVLAAACATPDRDAAWSLHAGTLTGRWDVLLQIDRAITAPRSTMGGTITLTENRSVDRALPDVGLPTNYGAYEIDFRPLGFVPSGGLVPSVLAGVTPGDTLQVEFETDRSGFVMRMTAPLASDSLRGTWFAVESRNPVASGTFLMTRHR